MDTPAPDAAEQLEYWEARKAGQFSKALSAASRGLVRQVLDLLEHEGHTVFFNRPPENSFEFYGGIVAALDAAVEVDEAISSYKVHISRELLVKLSELQVCLAGPRSTGVDDPDWLALALLKAFEVGSYAQQLGLTRDGHFDEFGRLKADHETRRERQVAAARKTNAAKATERERAIAEGAKICTVNGTLSNESVALKVRERLGLTKTVRTVTEWIRTGRAAGDIRALVMT